MLSVVTRDPREADADPDHHLERTVPWPFPGGIFPLRLGAVVQGTVARGELPALVVTHWADGDWTVADGVHQPTVEDSVVVHLRHLVGRDPSLTELADLPPACQAWRNAPGDPWTLEAHDPED